VQANNEDAAQRSKRQHETRAVRAWTGADGMSDGSWHLPLEIGGPFQVVLDAEADRLFRERSRDGAREPREAYLADALVNLVLGDTPANGVKHTVHVVIDHAALVRGKTVDEERCEIPGIGPVSVQSVRSLLGDAFLTAVIKKGRDIMTVAHLGRHVPAEVRTAMVVGGRECDVEGCECRSYLELDHSEVDFAAGGPTAWWNLTWMCWKHHRRKSSRWVLGPRNPHTGKRPLRPPGEQSSAA
jgi:hypothetical protein